jgi:hypothetical protein
LISRRSKLLMSMVSLAPLTWIILAFHLRRLLKEGESFQPPVYLVRLAPLLWGMFMIGCLSAVAALISLILDNRKQR